MTPLRTDWLTEGLIDFEYKKYVLLGYLLDVKRAFEEKKLYPALADVERHYAQLCAIKENKEAIHGHLPRVVSGIDAKNMKITYKESIQGGHIMQEIEEIVDFSIPKMEETLALGRAIHKKVARELNVFPVGLSPLRLQAGYIFIHLHHSNRIAIYKYNIHNGTRSVEGVLRIRTSLLGWEDCGEHITLEGVKKKVGRQHQEDVNFCTFAVTCDGKYPITHTLLPVTERIILQRLSTRM